MVTIWVGDDPDIQEFLVHKPVLTTKSGFFEAALHIAWKEGRSNVVDLPAANPEAFKGFVHFVYTGAVFTEAAADQKPGIYDNEWERLAGLYVLGETLLASGFKDAVITAMIEKATSTSTFPTNLASFVYANTCHGSKLRRLIVDFHVDCSAAYYLKEGSKCDDKQHGGQDFLADVLSKVLEFPEKLHDGGKALPWVENPCQYHEHAGDQCER